MVITSLSKDYELLSWNEQGEILQKEGMLTICFSYISFCSHRDRKELYLIIKIPYTVNMPTKKEMATQYQYTAVNFKKYAEWEKEVPKLKERIVELESDVRRNVKLQEDLLQDFCTF